MPKAQLRDVSSWHRGSIRPVTVEAERLPEGAGIAHELGNLIQIASSAVNIIDRDLGLRKPSNLETIVVGAKAALLRAGALVRQTLRHSIHVPQEIEAVCVAACLAEIRGLIQVTWPPNIDLDFRVAPDLPAVRCDRLGLQGAILNLALNARDAMPNGGMLSIEAGDACEGGSVTAVELRVSDNGMGMTRDTMICAFEPYFTTKSNGLGGVGLPMVKRFVEEVGGDVSTESEVHFGTTVTIRLPAS